MNLNVPRSIGRAVSLLVFLNFGLFLLGCSPKISNIVPSAGLPGDTVIITGEKLTVGGSNPSSVDFNGATANFKPTGKNVEAKVPKGATTGPVHIKTNYINSLSPGGVAASPFDFTVVNSVFTEKGDNDTRGMANNANTAQLIKGFITDQDKDWFKIISGPFGPWGYGIEITADAKNLPKGVELRVDIEGYRADFGDIVYLTSFSDDKVFVLWTTDAPLTDIYLKVSWVGSTSQNIDAPYTLLISRIAINDSNEDDGTFALANEIKMSDGIGWHKTSHLCNINKNGKDFGMKDIYFFKPNNATKINVIVSSAQLDKSDLVNIQVYDNTKGNRGEEEHNTNTGANFNLELTNGERASSDWYIEVTNAWDEYATTGAGPNDNMPLSCKNPYSIMVFAK